MRQLDGVDVLRRSHRLTLPVRPSPSGEKGEWDRPFVPVLGLNQNGESGGKPPALGTTAEHRSAAPRLPLSKGGDKMSRTARTAIFAVLGLAFVVVATTARWFVQAAFDGRLGNDAMVFGVVATTAVTAVVWASHSNFFTTE